MSFNKAESVAATSGYWRWVGDVEEMRKQRKSYRPKFRMNGTEAAIAAAFKKGVMRNLKRATHDAPFMPTKHRNALAPLAAPGDGGPAGVDTYNDAKRGFYHSMDTNHHDVVHQLLDHETKHVDAVDHLTVNHASPGPLTVPSSAMVDHARAAPRPLSVAPSR
ncbi:hypothetical protein JL722_7495 [Aureococcus anophagefferens]|nr:hypothetical protein JL722_7495 [Aureococcus anophagefferens]